MHILGYSLFSFSALTTGLFQVTEKHLQDYFPADTYRTGVLLEEQRQPVKVTQLVH